MNKNSKGITLVALVITITVLLIIAGISVYNGKETIGKAKLEELKTNMLFIQAKAKEHVEEANFKIGMASGEEKVTKTTEIRNTIYVEQEKLELATNIPDQVGVIDKAACYRLTEEAKQNWGLEKLKDEKDYIIEFHEVDASVQIYYLPGYNGKYSLSDIDKEQ